MLKLGKYNVLTINRETSVGLFLENEQGEEVLLPTKYIPSGCQIDDKISVFVYKDNENRYISTTLKPKLEVGQFGLLTVRSVTRDGAFLDWGIAKDIFVPLSEQIIKMDEGKSYLVYLYVDQLTDRLVASAKVYKFLNNDEIELQENQEVEVLLYKETDIGYNVIIDQKHNGLVYKNEVFRKIAVGEKTVGYIKRVREDNKIDVVLQKPVHKEIDVFEKKILDKLKENKGMLSLGDKSEPGAIEYHLEMSKKSFKKVIGSLYKKRLITVSDNTIQLV